MVGEILQSLTILARLGCHGLAPWSFTFDAKRDLDTPPMPRACPVVFTLTDKKQAGLLKNYKRYGFISKRKR